MAAWALPLIGTIAGGLFQKSAANKATNAQVDTSNRQIDVQEGMYDQTRSDLSPYRNTGTNAFNALANLYNVNQPQGTFGPFKAAASGGPQGFIDAFRGNAPASGTGGVNAFRNWIDGSFEESPDYQFRKDEAMAAADAANNARGGYFSGGAMSDITRLASDLASTEYGNFYNRRGNEWANYTNALQFMSNAGQNAAAMTGQAGGNMAAGVSNALANSGDARAAGAIAGGNAFNDMISNGLGIWSYFNPPGGNPTATTAPATSPRPRANPFF